MIRNTFSLLGGIGGKMEKRLWQSGVLTWDDFVASESVSFISSDRKSLYDELLLLASSNLNERNETYFAENLVCSEHWRLFDFFRGDTVYLDIETNGYQPGRGGYPTVVGLYDGINYRSYVWGENLTAEKVIGDLSAYKYLVTFYGSVFDIPFLERSLKGFDLKMPHFDLCFGARKMGLRGGLKRIEGMLGLFREDDVSGLNGYDAVLLWDKAKNGNSQALNILLKYNREDTVNLMAVANTVYQGLRSATGIEEFLQ